MSNDINVLALVKGEERYVILFDDNTRSEALRTLGKFASNPELSFSWYDAAVLGQKVRRSSAVESVAEGDFPFRDDAPHIDDPWVDDETVL